MASLAHWKVLIGAGLALSAIALLLVVRTPAKAGTDRVPAGIAPHSTAPCESVVQVDPTPTPSGNERVLFNRVALDREGAVADPRRAGGPLPYWAKSGLLVRGRVPVDLIVPRLWRSRLAITWGGN